MEHIKEIMRQFLLQQLDQLVKTYENKLLDKKAFEQLVDKILDQLNELDQRKD
ncbi:MAG: hypothetical protein ACOVQA_08805 [Thermoflexibacteraceae bacterium]|jgi:transcription termination factor NusB